MMLRVDKYTASRPESKNVRFRPYILRKERLISAAGRRTVSEAGILYLIPGAVSKKNVLISSGEYRLCLAHQRMVSAKSQTM